MTDPKIKMDNLSPYIGFLTNQKLYLSGIINELEAHNIDFSDRLKIRDAVFFSERPTTVASSLIKSDVTYIYMLSPNRLTSTVSAQFLPEVFNNQKFKILKVDKNAAEEYIRKSKLEK